MSSTVSLEAEFAARYGPGARIHEFFAPGRVNLIGEHIDYNGGLVLPAALTLGIRAIARRRPDRKVRLASCDRSGETFVDLEKEIVPRPERGWANYPSGVLCHLLSDGHELTGFDALYSSTLPDGVGLSSSAALEVLTAYLALRLSGEEPDRVYLARLCRDVENRFVGVNCGIMDQFAVAMGRRDHAMALDCATLECEHIPLHLGDFSLVVMDSGKRRELASSRYNERRSECDRALECLRRRGIELPNLCAAESEEIAKAIGEPIPARRARHAIAEQRRVKDSIRALRKGDLARFGECMSASHRSLRDDYEVTGPELDALFEASIRFDGCLGARMTGAGFGGCAIALVRTERLEAFRTAVSEKYSAATDLHPSFYASAAGDGVRLVASGA